MARIFTGVVVFSALVMGFVAGSGVVGWILTAGGYGRAATIAAGPVAVAPPAQVAPAAAQAGQQKAAGPEIKPEVKVVATDLKFAPSSLAAKVGQPLKVILENKGAIEHDIAFPGLKATDASQPDFKVLAKPGQTVGLEFTPTAKGSVEFICTIPGHREAGMRGMLGVIE